MKKYAALEDETTITQAEYYANATHDHAASCTCPPCCMVDESKLIARRQCYWCRNSVMFCTCPDGFQLEEAQ